MERGRVASSRRGPTPLCDQSAKDLTAAINRLASVLEGLSGPFGLKMHHTGIPAPYNQPYPQPSPSVPYHQYQATD